MPLLRLVISDRFAMRLIISPKRAAVDPDMSGKFRQSEDALLIERQQDTELARCNIVLCGQLFVEQVDAGIEQPNEKTEALCRA